MLEQAFARACQLGDPCWEGMSARGLALVADIHGDPSRAFDILADARRRCRRWADPCVWLDAYILDAQCDLGRRHAHPDVTTWTDTLRDLASLTGMKEMTVRSLLHGAALGREQDAEAATLLAADLDSPNGDRRPDSIPVPCSMAGRRRRWRWSSEEVSGREPFRANQTSANPAVHSARRSGQRNRGRYVVPDRHRRCRVRSNGPSSRFTPRSARPSSSPGQPTAAPPDWPTPRQAGTTPFALRAMAPSVNEPPGDPTRRNNS